jgi:hypothetical protein
MQRCLRCICVGFLCLVLYAQQGLDNEAILKLLKAGLSEAVNRRNGKFATW